MPDEMTRSFGFLGFDSAGRFAELCLGEVVLCLGEVVLCLGEAVLCLGEVVRVPLEVRRAVDEDRAGGEGTAALGRAVEF
ncbi:hypothetical protein [Nonomuraea sp. NPDC049309]|uniref:hypothetical protein n=1 Tax=Nonomuraea sp. NPDC049309 TaxID=3364350 RepID=UPI0037233A6D